MTIHTETGEHDAAVADGVYRACAAVMDATGDHPATRADILDPIRDGVHDAVVELIRGTTS